MSWHNTRPKEDSLQRIFKLSNFMHYLQCLPLYEFRLLFEILVVIVF